MTWVSEPVVSVALNVSECLTMRGTVTECCRSFGLRLAWLFVLVGGDAL